jgi:hypothetical protein
VLIRSMRTPGPLVADLQGSLLFALEGDLGGRAHELADGRPLIAPTPRDGELAGLDAVPGRAYTLMFPSARRVLRSRSLRSQSPLIDLGSPLVGVGTLVRWRRARIARSS